MTYVILDLEFNGAYSKKKHRFVNEIIEFGAVKCDEQLNIIDTFSALVNPQISKKLNSHVSRLTHINMSELQECNNTFTHVLSRFKKFLGDSVLMSWGTSDILVLMENCLYYSGDEKLPFITAYANAQCFCESALEYSNNARQMGLSTCAQLLGIAFEDDALHRALTDAELTALCFRKLYRPELLESMVIKCDDDFYRRITFKNYNICDLKSPDIDRKELYFVCDRCGRKAWRRGKWKLKNKSFRAHFRCLRCKHDFEGRITFKKTYDGVKVVRRAVDLPLPDSTPKTQDDLPAADEAQTAPAEYTVQRAPEKPAEAPVQKAPKKPAESPVQKAPKKSAEKASQKAPKKPVEKPAEKSPKKPIEPAPKLTELFRKKPTDQSLSD